MWQDKLKEAGVSIHVIATGAGAGIQQELWQVPGSSAYLSGASFPYSPEEQQELLGFAPGHFCSEEAAIDLASVAYMKAYKFGGKKPVGVGLTATVASEQEHRGEHRVFVSVITDDKVLTYHQTLVKGTGHQRRHIDGMVCDNLIFVALNDALELNEVAIHEPGQDATELARSRFFQLPFFGVDGQRYSRFPLTDNYALMSGAFNPPHQGHFGVANSVEEEYHRKVVFEITANPPHKSALTVQELLKRAKLLQGHPRLFTQSLPMYLDKARAYPGCGLVMGADAAIRLLDPKWGPDPLKTLKEFVRLKTKIYIAGRNIDGKLVNRDSIWDDLSGEIARYFGSITWAISGQWNISSTELRNKVI